LAGIDETLAALDYHLPDPAFRSCRRHVVDLRALTGYEQDFARFFALQARFAELLPPDGGEMLVVFVAPTRMSQDMAELARRTWQGLSVVAMRVLEDLDQALELLGATQAELDALARPARGSAIERPDPS